jgi:hypothetical protein
MTPDSVCPGQLREAYEDWAPETHVACSCAAGAQRRALTLSATECTEFLLSATVRRG